MKHPYIAFEGPDGSGKSTLSKAFAQHIDAFWTYEPNGQTEVTKLLRTICLDSKWSSELTAISREYLLLANRSISLNTVREKLQSQIVVTDRSFLSGLVYAKVASDLPFEEWFTLADKAITFYPDVIVLMKVDKANLLNKRADDIYDNAPDSFHAKIRATFDVAVTFIKNSFPTINIVEFPYSFQDSVEVNLEALEKTLLVNGLGTGLKLKTQAVPRPIPQSTDAH
jgi:dTMP kinase